MNRGVYITGKARTGTSMVAGLFAVHGVCFGRTIKGDRHNRGGYFEHPKFKRLVRKGAKDELPGAWWEILRADGANGGPWGLKHTLRAWPLARLLDPAVVIITDRPRKQVSASRKRWGKNRVSDKSWRKSRATMARIREQAACPVITVHTDRLAHRDYTEVRDAFRLLGVPFDSRKADVWIDPSQWHGRKR